MDSETKLKNAIARYNDKHNQTFSGDGVYQILGHCELMEEKRQPGRRYYKVP